MRSTSLFIADKVDKATCAVYRDVQTAADSLGIDCLVVGATARDLVYEAAFGLDGIRATKDIDFAVHVPTWDKYFQLKEHLIQATGFTQHQLEYRLYLPNSSLWIDLVPFGSIADRDGRFRWPGDPDIEFSTTGFREALDTSLECHVSSEPDFVLSVVHPAVLVMLKLFSWRNRKHEKSVDAQDAAYAMSAYVRLDDNEQRVHDEPGFFEGQFDVDTVGARLLGRDLAVMTAGAALDELRDLVREEVRLGDGSELLADMQASSRKLFADSSLYGHLMPNLLKGIGEG